LHRLVERLVAYEVRDAGVWRARCPAHRDRGQGLWIVAEHSSLKALICQRGCTQAAILTAMGWPTDALRPQRRRVASHIYRDAAGRELMRVERYDTPLRRRSKAFQVRWAVGVTPGPLPLYRWPELLAADPRDPVFLVEGEACVEAICALDLVATTSAGGAYRWDDRYAEDLRGRAVVILPDHDDAGERYAADAARALAGVAASVRVVRLPGLPPKGDVVQYLRQGHGRDALLAYARGEAPPVRRRPRLGPVEQAVVECLGQHGGMPRDQVPAWLWGWPAVQRLTQRGGRPVDVSAGRSAGIQSPPGRPHPSAPVAQAQRLCGRRLGWTPAAHGPGALNPKSSVVDGPAI
jgi:hypothetical protein